MHHLNIFINLTRLNKPVGFFLLFWPCSWSLAYAYTENQDLNTFLKYLILFFLGSVLMRSAGCIVNDIVDKDYDIKVARTKKRPIAAGKISVNRSLLYVIVLCSLAFFILIQFNMLTIILGLGSMILAFSYPYMKRFTYWPQLFLGLTFNWGIIMAWAAVNASISSEILILYLSAIFWTLGYDTIYGTQDMSDDEIIGLKSTSIKFKKNMKMFISFCYFFTFIGLFYLFSKSIGLNIFTVLFIIFILSLIYQVYKLKISRPEISLKLFKLNNYSGLLLFLSILSTGI